MHLIIFDIDGTLIHSHDQEIPCFEAALAEVTGITNIEHDIDCYPHITDLGIAMTCIERHLKRSATQEELAIFEMRFYERLVQTFATTSIRTLPGAAQLFDELNKYNDVALAIATGCFHRIAQLKLTHSKLPILQLPIASTNDSFDRTLILQKALNKAKMHYQRNDFKSITYIGDGPWDIKAVKALQWKFIGVASSFSELELRQWGAQCIIPDFLSPTHFINQIISQNLPSLV
ncbi:MAG: HAD family hydrolase [Candidatus Berkiellales bacterium]